MDEKSIQRLSRDECIEKLKEIGQHGPGTLEEMKMKLRKFFLYPKLYQHLKLKAQRQYKFECSLDPSEVPGIKAKWSSDEKFYPFVDNSTFNKYCSFKHQGNKGQQEKVIRMLQSRKIVTVKTIHEQSGIFVRAMIKKSYGTTIRPAVVLFQNSLPQKATCSCPVGLSGLCCHILALLLFLKHYTDTNEKILELTCTEQLQKWHRRSKKGSIPMVPLKQLKPKSAGMKIKQNKVDICPADPQNSYFKRDVSKIILKLKEKLKKEKPVEPHIHSVLINSKIGKMSSVGLQLNYNLLYVLQRL